MKTIKEIEDKNYYDCGSKNCILCRTRLSYKKALKDVIKLIKKIHGDNPPNEVKELEARIKG